MALQRPTDPSMLVPISSLNNDLHVVVASGWPDGTAWATIEDHNERRTQVCIDGRADSPTRYRIFEMARHPRESTARLVTLGSEEEDLIIGLLSRWYDAPETLKARISRRVDYRFERNAAQVAPLRPLQRAYRHQLGWSRINDGSR